MITRNKNLSLNSREKIDKTNQTSLIYGKMAPQATDLETAILGAVMLQPDKLIVMCTILKTPECFYSDANQRVYAALRRLGDAGKMIDIMTVTEELRKSSELEMVGGSFYITSLVRDVVSSAHLEEHCRIVMQKYILREIIRIGGSAIGEAYENSSDVFDLLSDVENNFIELNHYATGGQHVPISAIVGEYLENLHKPNESEGLIRTYFRDLDSVLGDLKGGCMYVFAARPGHGKTTLEISSTLQQSKRVPVGVWNGELTKQRFINRYIQNIEGIDNRAIDYMVKIKELDKIVDGASRLISDHKLFLDCTPNIEIDTLVAKIRYWYHVCGVKIIWLDYLNLISVSPEMEKYHNREQQLFYILKKLSAVCKECNIPLIILTQLNREVLKQADKIPNLGNLKEAGRIEEMVYFVGFINRPEEYGGVDDEHGSIIDRMDIHVRKHSDGKNNVDIHLQTQMQFCKVYDKEQIEMIFTMPGTNNTATNDPETLSELPF